MVPIAADGFSSCTGNNVSIALASSRHPILSPSSLSDNEERSSRPSFHPHVYRRLSSAFPAFARVVAQPRSVSTEVIPYTLHLGVTVHAFSIVGTIIFAIAIIMAFAVGVITLIAIDIALPVEPPRRDSLSALVLFDRTGYIASHKPSCLIIASNTLSFKLAWIASSRRAHSQLLAQFIQEYLPQPPVRHVRESNRKCLIVSSEISDCNLSLSRARQTFAQL
ncbi:hypothetical protein C8F01DRAFT_1281463 [Mycena amicta]|nr:hypothetical protein C8F01DRAFT_1281463 [Mycena amicta]